MARHKILNSSRMWTAPRLYAVIPDLPADEVLGPIAKIVAAVEVVVQVRCKSLPEDDFVELARRVTDLCHESGRLCVINDRVDIALEVGADGVHLGQSDMTVTDARQCFDGIVGSTCRTISQAQTATTDGADYLGVGPTFVSSTKSGLPAPLGVAGVSAVADSVEVPVYAIGGITLGSAATLAQTGVYGVAVVDAIFKQPDLAVARSQELVNALSVGRNQVGVS